MSKPNPGGVAKTPGWLDGYDGPSRPQFRLPAGAVDAHGHVFGPVERFLYAPERNTPPVTPAKNNA